MRSVTIFAPVVLALLCGCPSPDAEGKFNSFLDDTKEEREDAANMPDMGGGVVADVSGTFLFAVSAVLQPNTPLQFVSTQTFTPTPDGGGTLDLSLQPLSLDVGSTTMPRQPVGEAIDIPQVPVAPDGTFTIAFPDVVMVTGEANPITGSDIAAVLTLQGSIQSADFMCGTVTGMVMQPIMYDLMGSTFAAERTDPATLPLEVKYLCEGGVGGETGGDSSGSGDTGESPGTTGG
jgi:hypothetical protein